MFYCVSQNNVEGHTEKDEDVSDYVIMEASNIDEFQDKFEDMIGINDYCECCGFRWYYTPYEEDDIYPVRIIDNLIEFKSNLKGFGLVVHYANGSREIIKSKWQD